MSDFTYNLKNNFMTDEEWKGFFIASLFYGFIVSFREWGTESFNLGEGLKNLIIAVILVGIAIFVHYLGNKFTGFHYGHRVETFVWKTGMVVALIFTLLSNGRVWFIVPGGIILHILERQRLGQFRYGIKSFDIGKISVMGPIAGIILAVLCKYLFNLTGMAIFEKAMLINIALSICTMLPLPCISPSPSFVGDIQTRPFWHIKGPLNGGGVLIASRILFVLSFSAVSLIGLLLIFLKNPMFALLWGFLLALLVLVMFFYKSESKLM